MTDTPDTPDIIFDATAGRDNGKRFKIGEALPVEMATLVLRLLAAVRLGGVDELAAVVEGAKPDLPAILRLLAGCDPQAIRALILDSLTYVQVAADPRHPGLFRPCRPEDIQEMATLGAVLQRFARTNALFSG